jgi:hypothetical protein
VKSTATVKVNEENDGGECNVFHSTSMEIKENKRTQTFTALSFTAEQKEPWTFAQCI